MRRRTVLRLAGASAGLTALSGCQIVTGAVPDCLTGEKTTIWIGPTRHAEEYTEQILPFPHSELHDDYPDIVEEITSGGQYKRCSPLPDEAASFVTLVEERIDRQVQEYEGELTERMEFVLESAYVDRNDTIEKIDLYHEGELISGDTLLSSPGGENETVSHSA